MLIFPHDCRSKGKLNNSDFVSIHICFINFVKCFITIVYTAALLNDAATTMCYIRSVVVRFKGLFHYPGILLVNVFLTIFVDAE